MASHTTRLNRLSARHIQDHNAANTTHIPHFGYSSRVFPCTNDAGSCEYLDAVYWMHDVSMLYTFILWGVVLGILVIWVAIRGFRIGGRDQRVGGPIDGVFDWLARARRRWLLHEAPGRRLFGRVSRLQVVILAAIAGYLLVFSLIGITYKTWITPVKGSPGLYNTRTGLGGFADRVGALAYALTPLTILLSSRESILSLVTGIPYQHFNFLHRWLGYIIFLQALLHTLGWTLVEGYFYKPQPDVYGEWLKQMYAIFGVVAMFFLTLMMVLSTQWAREKIGYEAFKVSHWCLAMLYIAACWGHWDRLWCWMVPSLILIVMDQVVRAGRTVYLHLGAKRGRRSFGFHCAQASLRILGSEAAEDMVLRLDFDYEHPSTETWQAGQHFHICFPSLSIWQSHPFTPSSLPNPSSRTQYHTYILRVRSGITVRLAALGDGATVPAILTGPYGKAMPTYGSENVLAVAGGTGVTFTLPIALQAMREQAVKKRACAVEFVWVVRRARDLLWLADEMDTLRGIAKEALNLRVRIFVSREAPRKQVQSHTGSASEKNMSVVETKPRGSDASGLLEGSSSYSVDFLGDHHPSMAEVVDDFMERAKIAGGSAEVVGSGPEAMAGDLRAAIAAVKVEEQVSFYWDSRD